ncbi:MAG: SulP family inorganic anion transporter, partial [Alphaproteobacteria bacterium]|nr:SulP family inorganic anion transporter [Alphaproteobacteria bacterium]
MGQWQKFFPILDWGKSYSKTVFSNDMIAAIIVTIMLIPQSLAYAMIAGLPAQVGLYASILPLVAYAVFGTSRALAVGPVAVASLMTASALGNLGQMSMEQYIAGAIILAFISGLVLIVMGILKLGVLANYLSHPVISGFITASGILIAINQLKPLLGLSFDSAGLIATIYLILANIDDINIATMVIGLMSLGFLYSVKLLLPAILRKMNLSRVLAGLIIKSGPMIGVVFAIAGVWKFGLAEYGVAIVGQIPDGLPPFGLPDFDLNLMEALLVPAILISIVGFVESISVGQTLAAKRRQRIDPDQELIGLGAANMASSFSGGYPVTGGFARSVVNFDAGAETPAAGAFAAIGILLAAMFLTPALYYLPRATLAATIIVAVLGLVDFKSIVSIFRYSKADFTAMMFTIILTLVESVEVGIVAGVVSSIVLHLYRSSR